MPPDSTATKARLLAAAHHEFAQHGVAGARVDRIATAAKANKRLLYVYFGNKHELFDIVVAGALARLSDEVPFTADDLPGYAGALFDHLLAHPALLRLITWALLERPESTAARIATFRPRVDAIAAAQGRGLVTADLEPVDVLALTVSLAGAWSHTARPARRHGATDAARGARQPTADAAAWRDRQRAALTRAVGAATVP